MIYELTNFLLNYSSGETTEQHSGAASSAEDQPNNTTKLPRTNFPSVKLAAVFVQLCNKIIAN